ncbi:Dethiobiotin synthase [Paenibacillus nuruki]|uniref:Dethiobiotin synthase n=1 Tax=Paenibacillus nuruki TaxID=1886670 RepID=A0A1E3L1F7_9BACL|nr:MULTISPECIES: MDR family MFS transporter [Paenibacillus]ODP27483.1 Dethiobiotin synthase [Paenibacillus nuruki]TKJ86632.1 MFS transporter [Paenibacillus sp. CFBP13512]
MSASVAEKSKGASKTGWIVAGLLLGIFIAAIDNTIVATAIATIVGDLGGFDQFVWVTSAYLVASLAGTPIFGKLSDMYGRKRFFIFGVVVFMLGSILCGTADSIVQLSIYRAIQGIGGGALVPIAFTIVFDTFPPEKRGKMTGLLGAVFGMSSLFGPLLGAYITQYMNWRWVFYINVPFGIISFLLIMVFYHESMERSKQKIDWWGAGLLIGAVVSLMFALELGGDTYPWNSGVILGLFVSFVILLIAFIFAEKKAAEPIISFPMFKDRLFTSSTLAAFFYGAAFITVALYIPIYIQGVSGGTAVNSGLTLMPMTIGSVIAAMLGGILVNKLTFRRIMMISGFLFVLGMALLSRITPETPALLLYLYLATAGFGIGFSFSVLNISGIQNFDFRQRGAATSTLTFVRSLGMALGVTIFGLIQRSILSNQLQAGVDQSGSGSSLPPGLDLTQLDPRALLSDDIKANLPAQVIEMIQVALTSSIAGTFMWAVLPAIGALIAVSCMGKERALQTNKPNQK